MEIMKFISKTIILAFLVLVASQLTAQKFGYVNSAELLQMHPQINEKNAELEAFQKNEADQLQAIYQICGMLLITFECKGQNTSGTLR